MPGVIGPRGIYSANSTATVGYTCSTDKIQANDDLVGTADEVSGGGLLLSPRLGGSLASSALISSPESVSNSSSPLARISSSGRRSVRIFSARP
jgi:hypothetical protein